MKESKVFWDSSGSLLKFSCAIHKVLKYEYQFLREDRRGGILSKRIGQAWVAIKQIMVELWNGKLFHRVEEGVGGKIDGFEYLLTKQDLGPRKMDRINWKEHSLRQRRSSRSNKDGSWS